MLCSLFFIEKSLCYMNSVVLYSILPRPHLCGMIIWSLLRICCFSFFSCCSTWKWFTFSVSNTFDLEKDALFLFSFSGWLDSYHCFLHIIDFPTLVYVSSMSLTMNYVQRHWWQPYQIMQWTCLYRKSAREGKACCESKNNIAFSKLW